MQLIQPKTYDITVLNGHSGTQRRFGEVDLIQTDAGGSLVITTKAGEVRVIAKGYWSEVSGKEIK